MATKKAAAAKARPTTTATRPTDIGRWSFRWADILDEQSRSPSLTKGERTLLRLKTGVAEALETLPYQTVRVADIVELARVSHGLFYHYFTDKQEITIAVLSEMLEHLERTYEEIHVVDDDYESIFLPNLVYVNLYRWNAGLMRAALTLSEDVESFRVILFRSSDRWHQRIARSLARSRSAERDGAPLPIVTAYALGGMIDQLCQQVYAQRNSYIAEHLADVLQTAEAVSILWFRAVHGRDPTAAQIARARQIYRDFPLGDGAAEVSSAARTKTRPRLAPVAKGRRLRR
jgi:AcrR family transcriptional regulator